MVDGAVLGLVGVAAGVGVLTRFGVGIAIGDHVPGRGELGVLDGDDRLLVEAAPDCLTIKE